MPDELFSLIQTKRKKTALLTTTTKENPIIFFLKVFHVKINYIFTKFPGHVISKFYLFKLFFFSFSFSFIFHVISRDTINQMENKKKNEENE